MQWLRSKRYSRNTVQAYTDAVGVFLQFVSGKPLREIDNNDLIRFNNEYVLKRKLSASYQNQVVSAIKFFFRTVENRRLDVAKVHRPKNTKTLPAVLSKEEVKLILEAHGNMKHRAMLSLIYACGLRRGELINLKPADVDSKRHVLIIRQAKGRKDRIAPISEKLIEMLREYYRGVDTNGFSGLFGINLQGKTVQEARQLLIGKTGVEKAFSSCAVVKGKGFDHKSVIYNIYCPKGTKMLYVEPFSAYGYGTKSPNWDGKTKQQNFGNEIEMILQRNTTFRITKVEYNPGKGKWFIDIEVIGQM